MASTEVRVVVRNGIAIKRYRKAIEILQEVESEVGWPASDQVHAALRLLRKAANGMEFKIRKPKE